MTLRERLIKAKKIEEEPLKEYKRIVKKIKRILNSQLIKYNSVRQKPGKTRTLLRFSPDIDTDDLANFLAKYFRTKYKKGRISQWEYPWVYIWKLGPEQVPVYLSYDDAKKRNWISIALPGNPTHIDLADVITYSH